MIVECFTMQEKALLSTLISSVVCLQLWSICCPLCKPKYKTESIVKHTNAKILVGTLTPYVMS
jgi:hypothetical protein